MPGIRKYTFLISIFLTWIFRLFYHINYLNIFIHVYETHSEESVSQNFDICITLFFYWM